MHVDGKSYSARVYLLGDDGDYEGMRLVNQELTFDVDMSKMPCGLNGALYLSEMDLTGGRDQLNPAGSSMGTGYCDAQCPVVDFINGKANTNGSGSCCNEMDIWEADSEATSMTPHPCDIHGLFACDGTDCEDGADGGVCDKNGCTYNAYDQGYHTFYGPNGTVDTSRPFTVVTQFLADKIAGRATTDGLNLAAIRRIYIQGGKIIGNVSSTTAKKTTTAPIVIGDDFCKSEIFGDMGGLKGMGQALQRGMVLVFSIWNDIDDFMNWLDSGSNGPCSSTAGNPAIILAENPNASVTWSNLKWGDLGSTFNSS